MSKPETDEKPCVSYPTEAHYWPEDTADGDTCTCGEWYRFPDRIEKTPEIERG